MKKTTGESVVKQIKRNVEDKEKKREARIPNPFSGVAEKLCVVRKYHQDLKHGPEGATVRFAFVSMPEVEFGVATLSSAQEKTIPAGVTAETCERKLTTFTPDAAQRMFVAFEESLRVALEDLQVHVVCFSELGLPTDDVRPMESAKTLAHSMSQTYNALIIAGTGHDRATLCNTGYIFYPGGPPEGLSFHKAISAVRVGEKICAPSQRIVPLVKMFGLKIAFMICLDIADYASIASVVRMRDGVDVILVPCYSKKFDDMRDIAVVTSRALRGVVSLVNFNHKGTKRCHIARFGELDDPSLEKELSSGAMISLLDLPFDDFQKRRIELENPHGSDAEAAADLSYLFGIRDYWFFSSTETN